MGWRNPPVPWSELERRLSDKRAHRETKPPGDGGDSPAWARTRETYVAPEVEQGQSTTRYAELHCHTNFSFLDGASHPEELVEEAVRLGLEALAVTDHNGFYGVVRFAEAAREHDLKTVFGATVTFHPGDLTAASDNPVGAEDPLGVRRRNEASTMALPAKLWPGQQAFRTDVLPQCVILARDPKGYAQLGTAISEAQLAGSKGKPKMLFTDLQAFGQGSAKGHWLVLTGDEQGWLPSTWARQGEAAAARVLEQLVQAFGRNNVVVELWDHGHPLDSTRNDALYAMAQKVGVQAVATNAVRYHAPLRRRLATAMAVVRERRSLNEGEGWLPAAGMAHLRSGDEQACWFSRYPGVVERAADLALDCAFDLRLVAPNLPPFPCPEGHDEMSWLRKITEQGALNRYGPRGNEKVPGAYKQIDHELLMIDQLGFPGYFLIVWDIVAFCRAANILCQGRGSAANSAVCYAIGITNADAVGLGLLFERFLSPERDGPPDIDLDIESGRREEAIQYVYNKHGRRHAAQVANVITYRTRSSRRDIAKALGDAAETHEATEALEYEIENFPRHLGVHSGGMVICDRPVIEVCPVEWATKADRTVLQWDKQDCAATGLVKFDLLGLGMLTALHGAFDLVADHHGVVVDLATIPQDDAVYDMLCEADSIGVFQVESRAQMATLPRLRPRTFYDLVVEVALIRPGPIQGGSVHPYIRRRNGEEPVTFLHPLLERSLAKTLGIPLFQEQLMQMAIDVAGFSASEADELRQAMGSKRSAERMDRLRERFFGGMAERGLIGDLAVQVWEKLAAFANFGFPESHSVSFAYLVYASAWIKCHYPAAFCAALINAQPMGFYSVHTLAQDARRHGVKVHTPDLNLSSADSAIIGSKQCPEVRLGLASVRNVGDDVAAMIVAAQPYVSIEDLRRRVGLSRKVLESLATAGVFDCFGIDRRAALWAAGAMSQVHNDRLPGIVTGVHAPQLPGMSDQELALADLWASGVAPDGHPTKFLRADLGKRGVVPADALLTHPLGGKLLVAGIVTHRQRPATAGGTTFLNLEDEFGLINVIVSKGCWKRFAEVAETAPAVLVRGRLERNEGVVNVIAEHLEILPITGAPRSRDFR